MKKLLECVLCGALALSLAACGGKTGAGRGDAAPAAPQLCIAKRHRKW